jgi:small GTP-binding protein
MTQLDPSLRRARVVVIGDSSVGKTSILAALAGGGFNPYELNTVGANWQLYVEEVKGERIELQIWDTAGQERFRSLGPLYYRNATAGLVVYDITNSESFRSVPGWVDAFTSVVGTGAAVFLVGNKCDLVDKREVAFDEAAEWARERGFDFVETSARTADGIAHLFQTVAERVASMRYRVSATHEVTAEKEQSSCC